jgi:phage terminase large subunit-like protein
VLKFCASNCVIERDAAGNKKLSKKRSNGRIDGMIALVMALDVAPLRTVRSRGVDYSTTIPSH